MGVLIIHAGLPKTGTSAIQAALHGARDTLAESGMFWPAEVYSDQDPRHFFLHKEPLTQQGDCPTLVATLADSGEIIGCSRLYAVPDQPGDWGIGFTFLRRSHWGGGWNREMKRLMVGHVLRQHERVWFHIAPENYRSQIATTRLGARFQYDADLALGGAPTRMKCYVMTADDWTGAGGAPLA